MLNYYNKTLENKGINGNRSMRPIFEELSGSQRLLFSISSTSESKLMVKSLDIMTRSIKIKNLPFRSSESKD